MIRKERYRLLVMNIVVAVAISLIFNLASLIFMFSNGAEPGPPPDRFRTEERWQPPELIPGTEADQEGDIVSRIRANRRNNPPPKPFHLLQIIYLTLLTFTLVSISTANFPSRNNTSQFVKKVLLCVVVTMLFFYFAPKIGRAGGIILNINSRRFFDPEILLKTSSVLVVALLYGKAFELFFQKQKVQVENEKLKSENLQTTLNTLVNQINPHFFFNSLNSLSMLVREKHNDRALVYIDRLSDTFRYIIHNGHRGITTLGEELQFIDSSIYMLNIRYEGKISFDIEVAENYRSWMLPSLSLQPLIENAVKHNIITSSRPLTVSIHTCGANLVVSNPLAPKTYDNEGTGLGLKNLSDRYLLLMHKDINIENDGKEFRVYLPLTDPEEL